MSVVPLKLTDFSGGLNLRDPRSGIPKNQLAKLVNYQTDEGALLRKRGGQALLQYAPIDPQAFVLDANTLALWHLDDAAPPAIDSTFNYSLGDASTPAPFSVPGLFSTAFSFPQPTFAMVGSENVWSNTGGILYTGAVSPLHGKSAICFDAWCKIDPSFSGRPRTARINGLSAQHPSQSNDGSALIATHRRSASGPVVGVMNGISVHRDWDAANNRDATDCYLKFTLKTSGLADTETVIQSKFLPMLRWLHVRANYDSATGIMKLYVNGKLHATATPQGGGPIYDAYSLGGINLGIGGLPAFTNTPVDTDKLFNTFAGVIDEVRISDTSREGELFPFKKPLGKPGVLTKADGTNQLIAATDGGLYYTNGDQDWTLITATDPANGNVLSPTATWDMCLIADRLYMTNGLNTPLTWDGERLVPTFEAVNALGLSLSAGGTTHDNGTFKYVYTYMYGDLDETGFSPVATIIVAGAKDVNIDNIFTRHSNATGIRIYRTKAGGDQYYLLREIANDSSQTSLSLSGPYTDTGDPVTDGGADGVPDGTTPTNLHDLATYAEADTTVAATQGPKAQYYLGEHQRLMAAGMLDARYNLRISALGNPDVMRPASFVSVPSDRGFIVALYNYYGEVHVSLNGYATNVLSGTDETNWTLTTNLHPKVGARDHWSWDHRYPVGDAGPYIVVFAGIDGLYQYAGQDIKEISDQINPLFDTFSTPNVLKQSWLTTDQADFQAARNLGGGASINVQADEYETDGLREVPGQVRIVDQLDYLGLWKGTSPLVQGNVIAVLAGAALEEFFFATDATNDLFHTLDNFRTVSVIPGSLLSADERIIQIVRQGGAPTESYFLITDSAGTGQSSGGGRIFLWDNVGLNFVMIYATPLFYDLDVPFRIQSGQQETGLDGLLNTGIPGGTYYYANGGAAVRAGQSGVAANLFINHQQNVTLVGGLQTNNGGNVPWPIFRGDGPSAYVVGANAPDPTIVGLVGTGATSVQFNKAPGFYTFGAPRHANPPSFVGSGAVVWFNYTFYIDYTRREFPRWRGGTFSPQAFWDASNNTLCLLASSAEDANGNRTTYYRTLTVAGVLTNYMSAVSSIFSGDGTYLFFTTMAVSNSGTIAQLRLTTLAAPDLTYPLTVPLAGDIVTRLGQGDVSVAAPKNIIITKSFLAANQDHWAYTGQVKGISYGATQPPVVVVILLTQIANGDSGPIINEIVWQTTSPFKWFGVVDRLTVVAVYSFEPALTLASGTSVVESSPFERDLASGAATGIRSNLIFVVASNAAGAYLWADRLYWGAYAVAASNGGMVQLGVAGSWEVRGELTSKQNEIGAFDSFGQILLDSSGEVDVFMRNAATALALAASEVQQTVNGTIVGFAPPEEFAQWRIVLRWVYSVAVPLVSPFVKSVEIDYFNGDLQLPRCVAMHWRGRTYFAFARKGADENDFVIVYDKKNAFTTYEGWSLKGMVKYRGMMVALQDYELVQLEVGATDLGNIVEAEARTGVLADGKIYCIRDMEGNIQSSANQRFTDTKGHLEIVPMAGDDELSGVWALPIATSDTKELLREFGTPVDGFKFKWGQAYSLIIRTSKQEGTYSAVIDQEEILQQLDLKLMQNELARNYTGK